MPSCGKQKGAGVPQSNVQTCRGIKYASVCPTFERKSPLFITSVKYINIFDKIPTFAINAFTILLKMLHQIAFEGSQIFQTIFQREGRVPHPLEPSPRTLVQNLKPPAILEQLPLPMHV